MGGRQVEGSETITGLPLLVRSVALFNACSLQGGVMGAFSIRLFLPEEGGASDAAPVLPPSVAISLRDLAPFTCLRAASSFARSWSVRSAKSREA